MAGRGDEEHHGEDGGRPELLNGELHINYYTRFYQQTLQISHSDQNMPRQRHCSMESRISTIILDVISKSIRSVSSDQNMFLRKESPSSWFWGATRLASAHSAQRL